ncbi:hypothetical protein F5050DRAFT_1897392 [Lentinula boryana]|uniref:Uncharacterized protein n=1 Tax=Lentinula boryana TaxID=40481 RepID=A0ABQ8Q3M3_9AGAR|nr:hypothetical protein F5050DRAFT_1897392 [Lentinula boryana]
MNLIWAFGAQNPGFSTGDAPFQFHVDAGYAHFDLSKPISPSSDKVESSTSAPSPSSSSLTSTKYKNEWPKAIGREDVMEGVNVVWYAWIVILPILYFAELILLPKQLAQEAANRSLWKKWKGL